MTSAAVLMPLTCASWCSLAAALPVAWEKDTEPEPRNVSLDGQPCYACEPPRLPACTEATDQCTPEACACANSRTHVKYNARVSQEPLRFYEQVLQVIEDVIDTLIDGACELVSWPFRPGLDDDLLAELPTDLPRELSLVLAARQGQHHLLEALLDSQVDPNATDPHGGTALLRAVQLGITARPSIEALLKAKADVSRASSLGETPLGEAAGQGPPELVARLLEANTPSADCLRTSLEKAAQLGNRQTTRMLLSGLAAAKAVPSAEALIGWVNCGDAEMVLELLKGRTDVNQAREHDGATAVLVAASSPNPQLIQLLCAQLADVNCSDRSHRTPLAAASAVGADAAVGALLAANAQHLQQPVAACNFARHFCLHERIPRSGAAYNEPQSLRGAPPLAIAVAAQHISLVEELLRARADVDALSERGQTPLMLAAAAGHQEMSEKLLEAGAQVNDCSEDGKTALILAAGIGSPICQLLLSHRADLQHRSATGISALHTAAANGHEELCRALLAQRADAGTAACGRTAAQVARRAGYGALAELLETGSS
eukprot:g24129.t1